MHNPPIKLLTALLLCLVTINSLKLSQQDFLGLDETFEDLKNVFATQVKMPETHTTKKTNQFTLLNTIQRLGRQFFTEGLSFTDANTLLESSGEYGKSVIQYVNAADMKVLKQQSLEDQYFGEGCELLKIGDADHVYQLTWQERKLLVWDANTFELKNMMDIPSEIVEGWGMAKRTETDQHGYNQVRLYVSDGTHNIYVVDPGEFKILRKLAVVTDGELLRNLNELEFVKGKLWANIYLTNTIAVIDPMTGFVETIIDLSPLEAKAKEELRIIGKSWAPDYVLNGIAYHPDTDRLLVTGKMWPMMFEIKVEGV